MGEISDLRTYLADRRAEGLDRAVHQWSCLATLRQYRHLHRDVAQNLRRGDRVLDWGCGNGHFAHWLDCRGEAEVHAFSFDAPPPAVAARPSIRHARGRQDEPVALPYDDETFDLVFSVGVLEHVWQIGGDEGASLREIRRILRPGGRFICHHFPNRHGWIEPAMMALSARLAVKMGGRGTFHFRKYGATDIERLCAEADLEPLGRRRYNLFPRNALRRCPRALVDTPLGVGALDALDAALALPLARFAQNHAFVARRPA